MIVNKNLQSSVPYNITFKGYQRDSIVVVNSFIQGRLDPFKVEQMWLAPGCGILLTVK